VRDEVLSVADTALEMAVSLFPNPTIDFVNISVSESSRDLSVNVYSLTGKQVRTINSTQSDMRINVRDLTSGIYLLEVIDASNNARVVQRVIKR